MEQIAFGVDLAGVDIKVLDKWIEKNRGLDRGDDIEGYQLLHTVFAYRQMLALANERNMVLRPTVLDFQANYHLEPKPAK